MLLTAWSNWSSLAPTSAAMAWPDCAISPLSPGVFDLILADSLWASATMLLDSIDRRWIGEEYLQLAFRRSWGYRQPGRGSNRFHLDSGQQIFLEQ